MRLCYLSVFQSTPEAHIYLVIESVSIAFFCRQILAHFIKHLNTPMRDEESDITIPILETKANILTC